MDGQVEFCSFVSSYFLRVRLLGVLCIERQVVGKADTYTELLTGLQLSGGNSGD